MVCCCVGKVETEWAGERRCLFQNHAVSICEDPEGNFISEDEAHYICAILNAPICEQFILQSSDARTFKIRPPIYITKYNSNDERHITLAIYSREAHDKPENVQIIREKINEMYLSIC
jgi:hypothetical protein